MGHASDALIEQDTVLRQRYHQLASSDARPSELRAAEEAIRANAAALSASIADGSKPCPTCSGAVAGIRKTPPMVQQGRELSALYEVGCAGACRLRARGPTPLATVEAWNAGAYFKEAD